MSSKNKQYIVPTLKPRNLLVLNPLMKRGGSMGKSDRDDRHQVNTRLAQLTKEETLDDSFYDTDDYGLGM